MNLHFQNNVFQKAFSILPFPVPIQKESPVLISVPEDMPPPPGDEPAFSSWSAVATAVNVSVADHTAMCVEECRKDCDAHGSGEEVKCFGKVGHGGLDQNGQTRKCS